MPTTMEVGQKLVQLCREGKSAEAIDTLYSPDIVSIEAGGPPGESTRKDGIAAVRGKLEWWTTNHTTHSAEVRGPFPHGDRFVVFFKYDVTAKGGPMAGQRFQMEEAALYTLHEGKIIQEEFFYHMG